MEKIDKSKTNIHYDRPAEFYKTFLDPYMKYTSGLFISPQDSLEDGARQMLDSHLQQISKFMAPNVLEVGPGWGSLLRRARERNVNWNYSAINPSLKQNDYIFENLDSSVELIHGTFENSNLGDRKYDAIYFIGSFCHMVNKVDVILKVSNHLSDKGVVVIEDTFFCSSKKSVLHANSKKAKFIQNEVFGFAEIMSVPEFTELIYRSEFTIDLIFDHSESYSKSISFWLEGLKSASIEKYPFLDSYIKYLEIGQKTWGYAISNYFIVLKKISKKLRRN